MGLDLQKWNPFRFARGRAEAPPAATRAAAVPQERQTSAMSAEALDPSRLLQALDPFGLLSGVLGGPLAGAGNAGRWFGDFSPATFQPRIDAVDDGDALRITAEVPGVDKQDLDVVVEDGFLVLRGEKRVDSKQEEKGCYRLERAFGSFRRVLPLPDGVDAGRAEARFANGVLTLRLPKKAGDGKPSRKVEIQ